MPFPSSVAQTTPPLGTVTSRRGFHAAVTPSVQADFVFIQYFAREPLALWFALSQEACKGIYLRRAWKESFPRCDPATFRFRT